MRFSIIVGVAGALLAGCASQPPAVSNPKQNSNAAAVVGMLLVASAAQDKDSAAYKLWRVEIPPTAFEVIRDVEDRRRKLGKWPTKDEISIPPGVKEIVLTEGEGELEVSIKNESVVSLRCHITQDGTVVIAPPFLQFMSPSTNQMQRTPQ
jgi:hypothetical protein